MLFLYQKCDYDWFKIKRLRRKGAPVKKPLFYFPKANSILSALILFVFVGKITTFHIIYIMLHSRVYHTAQIGVTTQELG